MRIERRDDDITVQNKEVMISVKTVRGSINWSGDVTTWLKTYWQQRIHLITAHSSNHEPIVLGVDLVIKSLFRQISTHLPSHGSAAPIIMYCINQHAQAKRGPNCTDQDSPLFGWDEVILVKSSRL
ncbi:hypothetical protein HZ326_9023 [Fusarium oxysporum f. sp. albedinis]|nr:hypothetical protein HZ326_9023 [Fusarium oxysporum f. sp. albedinis]